MTAIATNVKNTLNSFIQSKGTKNTAIGSLTGAAISFTVTLILVGGNLPLALTAAGISALATVVLSLVNIILKDVFNNPSSSVFSHTIKHSAILLGANSALTAIFPYASTLFTPLAVGIIGINSMTIMMLMNGNDALYRNIPIFGFFPVIGAI